MYTFTDKGDRSLHPAPRRYCRGGAGLYSAQPVCPGGGVQRLWYTGPMYRYERPQKGRQRQFHQVGVELIGSHDPRADVEVIALATDLLKALGLQNLTFYLNSVGDKADRTRYREALVNYFTPFKADLDQDSQDRLIRNPLRILDSKDEKTQAIAKDAPSILDYLGEQSQRHFDQVLSQLSDLGITYELNPRLVRGLDYYTHTAFEIQSNDLGSQSAVCGGGRYDGLVEELGRSGHSGGGLGHRHGAAHPAARKAEPAPVGISRPLYRLPWGKGRSQRAATGSKASPRWPGRRTRPQRFGLWQTVQAGRPQWCRRLPGTGGR